MYLLDIVLALVPYLNEKRLELLEEKLKQLFSMVIRNEDFENKYVFELFRRMEMSKEVS
jgi:hypothetical protein